MSLRAFVLQVRTRPGCPEPEEVFNENLKQLDSELSSIERRFQVRGESGSVLLVVVCALAGGRWSLKS